MIIFSCTVFIVYGFRLLGSFTCSSFMLHLIKLQKQLSLEMIDCPQKDEKGLNDIGTMVMDEASKMNTENLPEEEVIDELLEEEAAPMSVSGNELDDYTDGDEQGSQITDASEESSSWSHEHLELMMEPVIDLLADEQNGETEVNQSDGLPETNGEKFFQFPSSLMPDRALQIVCQMIERPVNGMEDAMAPEWQQRDRVETLLPNQGLQAEASSRGQTCNRQRAELEATSSSTEVAIALNLERQSYNGARKSKSNVGRRAQACAREKKMKGRSWLPSIPNELSKENYPKSIVPTRFSPVSSSIKEPLYRSPIWWQPNKEWVRLNSCGMSRKVASASASKVSMNDVEAAACGGVIRDRNGHPLLSFVKQLDKVHAYTAKAMGVYHGVLMLFSLPEKVNNVWVECDSREVVYFVSANKMEGMAVFKLLQEFEHWTITFVEDRGNALAKGVVAFGMDTGDDFCIHGDLPPPLRWLL